jgi:hypothetical protein
VSPFNRKGLGPWLAKDGSLIHDYDVIVASSVDRLGRNFRDMCTLRDWADDNEKSIVVLEPALHWPPATEDMVTPVVWDLLARFAEWELKTITKRQADARAKVRENRGFLGRPPFGFEVVGERYNRTIQPMPELADTLRELVRRSMRGDTLLSLCHWLDSEGIDCPRHGQIARGKLVDGWTPTTVRNILTNTALKGEQVNKDGKVMHRHAPLISVQEWDQLQSAMYSRTKHGGGRMRNGEESALLTGVISCEKCGGPMFRVRSSTTRKDGSKNTIEYYRCKGRENAPSKCSNMINLNTVDNLTHLSFMNLPVDHELNPLSEDGQPWSGVFANLEIFERITIPGSDHSVEIAEVEDQLRALDYDDPSFATRQATLLAERRRLQGLPVEATQVVERPTGRTVGDLWADMDHAARRRYLLASEVRVLVMPGKGARMEGDPSKITAALRTIAA